MFFINIFLSNLLKLKINNYVIMTTSYRPRVILCFINFIELMLHKLIARWRQESVCTRIRCEAAVIQIPSFPNLQNVQLIKSQTFHA